MLRVDFFVLNRRRLMLVDELFTGLIAPAIFTWGKCGIDGGPLADRLVTILLSSSHLPPRS